MSLKFVQAQSFTLAGSGASLGDTTITLSSFLNIDGSAILMTQVGDKGYMTLEPGNGSKEEQISFTGIVQNLNGTATLSNVKTVQMVSPYIETPGLAQTHAGGITCVLSNTSGFYNQFLAYVNLLFSYWGTPVATYADLPAGTAAGQVRVTLDTNNVYIWTGVAWTVFTANAVVSDPAYYVGSDSVGADLKTFPAAAPFVSINNLLVTRNGAVQAPGASSDYITSGQNVVFNSPVAADDSIGIKIIQ